MFFFSFALAGQFLTAEPHCSSEVQRLSCWSQSVNQLSSRYISRSINIGSTEGDLPEPSWGSPAQCHHRHLGITPHNSQHGVWGLRPLCIASLSGYTLISTTSGGNRGESSFYGSQMWWWSMICSSVLSWLLFSFSPFFLVAVLWLKAAMGLMQGRSMSHWSEDGLHVSHKEKTKQRNREVYSGDERGFKSRLLLATTITQCFFSMNLLLLSIACFYCSALESLLLHCIHQTSKKLKDVVCRCEEDLCMYFTWP